MMCLSKVIQATPVLKNVGLITKRKKKSKIGSGKFIWLLKLDGGLEFDF